MGNVYNFNCGDGFDLGGILEELALNTPRRFGLTITPRGSDTSAERMLYEYANADGCMDEDGQVLHAEISGIANAAASIRIKIRLGLGGPTDDLSLCPISFDSGFLPAGITSWVVKVSLVRVDEHLTRCSASLVTDGSSKAGCVDLTDIMDFNQTLRIRLTGGSVGHLPDDLVMKCGYCEKWRSVSLNAGSEPVV